MGFIVDGVTYPDYQTALEAVRAELEAQFGSLDALDGDLADINLDDPTLQAYFRLAVLFALKSEKGKSLEYLRGCFEREPQKYVPLVLGNLKGVRSEFDSIRYTPEFGKLLDEYREYWGER